MIGMVVEEHIIIEVIIEDGHMDAKAIIMVVDSTIKNILFIVFTAFCIIVLSFSKCIIIYKV